jgi:hypothetical protein
VHGTDGILLMCVGCILSYVQYKCVSHSLTAECTLPCIASICVMHSTLQRNIMWIAFTPLESVQIQEALTTLMSFMCCIYHHECCLPDAIPGRVCVFKSCLDTAECWKMHVMCQVTLQFSLSLFELITQQVATLHAVCLILYRDVCLQVLS